jgi:hypothetical protein
MDPTASLQLQAMMGRSVDAEALAEAKKGEFWEKIQMPIAQALVPVQHLETQWSPAELQKRVVNHFYKQMLKFDKEERLDGFKDAGPGCTPGAVLYEFVETVMSAVAYSCYDKPWFGQVDFTGPLYAASLVVFRGRRLFSRTTGARFQGWIVEAFNRWNEDQRIEKVMSDTVQAAGLNDHACKDLTKHLTKAYDQSHAETTLIAPESETPEMSMLQDFVECWYKNFVVAAWKTLCANVQGGRDGQMAFTSALFQTLSSPDVNCLPNDLTAPLDPDGMLKVWQQIAEGIDALYGEAETRAKSGGYYATQGNNWAPRKKPKSLSEWKNPEPMKLMQLPAPVAPMNLAMPKMQAIGNTAQQDLGPLY